MSTSIRDFRRTGSYTVPMSHVWEMTSSLFSRIILQYEYQSLRRCKVIHFYGQPSETWITHLQDDTMSLGCMVIEQQTQSRKFDVNVTKWTVKWAHDQVSSSSHAGVICMSGCHVLTVINVWTKHDEHNYRLWGIRETDLIMKTWRKVSNVTRPWKLD
jgi:hypothetical protein